MDFLVLYYSSHLSLDWDTSINPHFLPSLTDQTPASSLLWQLLSLPIREGGLGIVEPSKIADYHYSNSIKVTTPLVSILTNKSSISVLEADDVMLVAKRDVHHSNHTAIYDDIYKKLTTSLKKCVDIAREKDASSWLSAHPILKHTVMLYTNEHLLMQFASGMGGNQQSSFYCVCGKPFSVEQSLSCSFGGSPTIRHNGLRNVTADLLSQVCSNVCIEPQLQSLSGETLSHHTSNSDDHARLDVSARGFWNASKLSWMSGYSILWLRATLFNHYPAATERMRMRRNEHMKSMSGMLNMVLYTFSFFSYWWNGTHRHYFL